MENKIKKILASKSPRRIEILKMIGLDFDIAPSELDEKRGINLKGKLFAEYWSKEKAKLISNQYPDSLVIGADTVVVFNDQILGKPKDKNDSKNMIEMLSGNIHEVITGVTLICKNKQISNTFSETTSVVVKKIPNEKINFYIDNYKTSDKAGSYGIQEWFSIWIKKINGCYYNVMGLPISKFYDEYSKIIRHF
jgi:septum formation protein